MQVSDSQVNSHTACNLCYMKLESSYFYMTVLDLLHAVERGEGERERDELGKRVTSIREL